MMEKNVNLFLQISQLLFWEDFNIINIKWKGIQIEMRCLKKKNKDRKQFTLVFLTQTRYTPNHNFNHCLGLALFNCTTLLDTMCQKYNNNCTRLLDTLCQKVTKLTPYIFKHTFQSLSDSVISRIISWCKMMETI